MKKFLVLLLASTAFLLMINTNAEARISGYSYKTNNKVTVTKSKKVYKVTTGNYEAANKFKYVGDLATHSTIKVSNWLMSTGGGYAIKGYQFQPTKDSFYFVFSGENSSWFKKYNAQEEMKYKEKQRNERYKESMAKLNAEMAKSTAAINKIKREEKAEDEKDKQLVKDNPLLTTQYTFTSDKSVLDSANFSYDKSINTIYEDYNPDDPKAVLPTGFNITSGMDWVNLSDDSINNQTSDSSGVTYEYMNDKFAKENGYDHAGWVNDKGLGA
ncbi:hypothetical protein [Nicoliella lavandulae]|uniref:Surface layer protein A domain-containing protein n=1 Tax=Nicoliella lavandulae TaxID=3082954 RepID=A0ABU8SP25_9LACO